MTPRADRGMCERLTESLPFSFPATLTDGEKAALREGLCRTCPDPEVLAYRAEFAEELTQNPALAQAMEELSRLLSGDSLPRAYNETAETEQLNTVTNFEEFAPKLDRFCANIASITPESAAARRCFLACRTFADGYQYRELKGKAAELRRALGFETGFTLSPREEGLRLVKEGDETEGVWVWADRLCEELGGTSLAEEESPRRPYTDRESAVLTGIVRKNPKIARLLLEFLALYDAADTENILRLSKEALFYTAMNKIYSAARDKGYPLCRPTFRAPGFYSEITGLAYPTADGSVGVADYISTPLSSATAVWGPDGEGYVLSVAFAHAAASAGGLIFAEEAGISPAGSLEFDQNKTFDLPSVDEHRLCVGLRLFEGMFPRQEEETAGELLLALAQDRPRSVLLLQHKSNLAGLDRRITEGTLPPCTLLQLGEDNTLQEFMLRRKKEEEE